MDKLISRRASEPSREGMEMKTQEQAESGDKVTVTSKSRATLKARRYVQIFLAEFIATALLLFLACLGCMEGLSSAPLSPLQSPLTTGLSVGSLIAIFGHITNAHMNPAVTACFLALGKIDVVTSLVYFVAEMVGAITGVGLLKALMPWTLLKNDPGQCETNIHAEMSTVSGAFFEFIITSVLIYLLCALLDSRNSTKQDSGAIKFGLLVAALSFAGGAMTGASLNPARSFAPALWSGNWSGHWAYWAGPMAAGFLIPKIYQFLFEKDYTINSDQ